MKTSLGVGRTRPRANEAAGVEGDDKGLAADILLMRIYFARTYAEIPGRQVR